MRSSLQKLYGRHHELVNRCEISISQMRIDGFFRFILYLWNTSIVFEEFEVSIVDLAVANDFLLATRSGASKTDICDRQIQN
jgi:hypothetical protein